MEIWGSKECGPPDLFSVLSWTSDTPFAFPHHGETSECGLGSREQKGPVLLLFIPITQPPT